MFRLLKWVVLVGVAVLLYSAYPSAEWMAAHRECSDQAWNKVERVFGKGVWDARPTFAGHLFVDLTDKCEKARRGR